MSDWSKQQEKSIFDTAGIWKVVPSSDLTSQDKPIVFKSRVTRLLESTCPPPEDGPIRFDDRVTRALKLTYPLLERSTCVFFPQNIETPQSRERAEAIRRAAQYSDTEIIVLETEAIDSLNNPGSLAPKIYVDKHLAARNLEIKSWLYGRLQEILQIEKDYRAQLECLRSLGHIDNLSYVNAVLNLGSSISPFEETRQAALSIYSISKR